MGTCVKLHLLWLFKNSSWGGIAPSPNPTFFAVTSHSFFTYACPALPPPKEYCLHHWRRGTLSPLSIHGAFDADIIASMGGSFWSKKVLRNFGAWSVFFPIWFSLKPGAGKKRVIYHMWAYCKSSDALETDAQVEIGVSLWLLLTQWSNLYVYEISTAFTL